MTQKQYGVTIVWLALAALLLLMVYGYALTGRFGNLQVSQAKPRIESNSQKASGLVPDTTRVAQPTDSEETYYLPVQPVTETVANEVAAAQTQDLTDEQTEPVALEEPYYSPVSSEQPFTLSSLPASAVAAEPESDGPKEVEDDQPSAAQQLQNARDTLKSLSYDKIRFEFNSMTIAEDGVAVIEQASEILKANPEITVRVVNYTDSFGDDNYNLELSRSRAREVYRAFVGNGVDRQQLSYLGLGESDPVATNATLEGRRLNRRTVIQLVEGENR